MLVLETRMADVGQLFGQAIFEDAIQRRRRGGALAARARASTRSCSRGTRAARPWPPATRRPITCPTCAALVCLGNPWGLPQSMKRARRAVRRPPDYAELDGGGGGDRRRPRRPEHDRLVVVERSRGPSERRPTARSTRTAPGGTPAGPPPIRDGLPPDRAGAGADPAGAGHR